MTTYKIKTSTSDPYTLEYRFSSIKAAKQYFCDKILSLDYDDKDGFSISSNDFETMGVLLAKYSNEKCYAIKSLGQSVSDLNRWGKYERESGRTNREITGDEYFLNSVGKKCNQLYELAKLHVKDVNDILMPNICCEAVDQSPADFKCVNDYNGYSQMLTKIGCSKYEGLCEGDYDTFKSDL